MVAPLLFAVSAAVLLVSTRAVRASRVLLQSRVCGGLLGWTEGYDPEAPGSFAAADAARFGHEPHHLEVHGAKQAAAPPSLEEAHRLLRLLAVLTVEHWEALPANLAAHQLVSQYQCVLFFLFERVAHGPVTS